MFIVVYLTLVAIAVSLIHVNRLGWKCAMILSMLPPLIHTFLWLIFDLFETLFSEKELEILSSIDSLFLFITLTYILILPVFLLTSAGVLMVEKRYNLSVTSLSIFGAFLGTTLLALYMLSLKFWLYSMIDGFLSVMVCSMICRVKKQDTE